LCGVLTAPVRTESSFILIIWINKDD